MSEREYVLMLTQQCNFRCTYCYQTHAAIDQERAVVERFASFLRQHPRPNTRVVFHGGEPLLRKDLMQYALGLLTDADGRAVCKFGIVTNGSLIDDETLATFRRYRFKVGVSFDGVRAAQRFRNAPTFDAVVAAIERLVPLHDSGELELRVSITATLENFPYLARSVAFLTELGIQNIEIEGDAFGAWVDGSEQLIEEQVELVVQQMEQRAAAGLHVPVGRLPAVPFHEDGSWWESDASRAAKREARLDQGECNCGSAGASLIDANGVVWACPMFAPGLGQVDPGRLQTPDAFRYGTWKGADGPTPEVEAAKGARIRAEPIMGPKRERYSIFGECATCAFVADCNACPAGSHLPDVKKSAAEVPPLLCALNMAFLSRRHRIKRPVTFFDILDAVRS